MKSIFSEQGASTPCSEKAALKLMLLQFINDILANNEIDYLEKNFPLLLQKDAKGQTPLHLAIRYGRRNTVKKILELLVTNNQSEALMVPDKNGFTPLHGAVSQDDYKIYCLLMDALGGDAKKACRKITKKGVSPIALATPSTRDGEAIYEDLLMLLIKTNEVKNLDVPVSIEATLREHTDLISDNPILKDHLYYSCIAANLVRKRVTKCSTNPNSNLLSDAEFSKVLSACEDSREKADEAILKMVLTSPEDHDETTQAKLNNICSPIAENSAARCYEYAALVLDTLIKLGIRSFAEVYMIENGDHVFAVLGRDPASKESDFTTWGPNAVVIDAWAGEVYAAQKIPEKLQTYTKVIEESGRRRPFTVPFDPTFHKLKKEHRFSFTPEFLLAPKTMDCCHSKRDKIILLPHATLSLADFYRALNKFTKYKNGYFGLRWLSSSQGSADLAEALKDAVSDAERYQLAADYIKKFPHRAFSKALTKVMYTSPAEPAILIRRTSSI